MINTVVFDLGAVLIDWNPDYVFKTIFTDPKEMKWFYDNICTSDWNEEQDAGRPLSVATDELVIRFPEHENNIRAYYGRWVEMLKGPIHGTVDILKELKEKEKHQLYALTNWSHETFPIALERFDFLHWFKGIVVSGAEKTRKPHKDIYEILLNRYQIESQHAVFIDDNLRNLVPAKEMGFNVIHFQNPDQLRLELKSLDILL